jgi:hypothetical protein
MDTFINNFLLFFTIIEVFFIFYVRSLISDNWYIRLIQNHFAYSTVNSYFGVFETFLVMVLMILGCCFVFCSYMFGVGLQKIIAQIRRERKSNNKIKALLNIPSEDYRDDYSINFEGFLFFVPYLVVVVLCFHVFSFNKKVLDLKINGMPIIVVDMVKDFTIYERLNEDHIIDGEVICGQTIHRCLSELNQ